MLRLDRQRRLAQGLDWQRLLDDHCPAQPNPYANYFTEAAKHNPLEWVDGQQLVRWMEDIWA